MRKQLIALLGRYTFGTGLLVLNIEKLLHKVVHYAAGLPLTIKVLGSFLSGKDELEWKDALERLERIPLIKETLEKLESSYIGLEEDYNEICLDVAGVLKSSGLHAKNGSRVLEQKSLTTMSNLCVDVHDTIEEISTDVVGLLDPSRLSQSWIYEEIEDILDIELGTEVTSESEEDCPEIVKSGLGNVKEAALWLFS